MRIRFVIFGEPRFHDAPTSESHGPVLNITTGRAKFSQAFALVGVNSRSDICLISRH